MSANLNFSPAQALRFLQLHIPVRIIQYRGYINKYFHIQFKPVSKIINSQHSVHPAGSANIRTSQNPADHQYQKNARGA